MLRHRIPFVGFDAVDRTVEQREIVPRFKAPVTVTFRRDGDLGAVTEVIRDNRQVVVNAAVGGGKSTKLPLAIAKATGKLVIHTIPFHIAARYLAEYLMRQEGSDGEKFVYMDDLEVDMPKRGVVITTNAFLVALHARNAFQGISDAILYLDESHESDASTAVVRDVTPMFKCFSSIIRATATPGPGDKLKAHLPGERQDRTFKRTAVGTWSASDEGVPWSATQIEGNTLLCIDREEVRNRLQADYRQHGFEVRICTARSTYEHFLECMSRLNDSHGGIVIVMVDYAYRSSFTIMGLNDVVDSGEVAVPSVENNAPKVRYRPAFDFETQQLLGRGGRVKGESVRLWKPVEPAPTYMCDLEELERDAANLIYRIMGFRPPISLSTSPFYEGDVPMDIAAAMASDHPLRLCPEESRVPWINGDKVVLKQTTEDPYRYEIGTARGRRTVSCHTVVDEQRQVTPPPPVPKQHSVTAFDLDDLDKFSKSRDSSPIGTAYTIESDAPDNLSIFDEDSPHRAFQKPKRVAKRFREQTPVSVEKTGEKPLPSVPEAVSPVVPDAQASLKDVAGFSSTMPNLQPSVAKTVAVRRVDTNVAQKVREVHRVVEQNASQAIDTAEESAVGNYVYYHGMDQAPKQSAIFFNGVDSIVAFAAPDRAQYIKGLPSDERLYAVRVLVDAYNHATAVAMGIQRLFAEVGSRPSNEWQSLLDHDSMMSTLDWMVRQSAEAQARVRIYGRVLPMYMERRLDVIPPAIELENRIMVDMMAKFEEAAIKKDPDKAQEYMRRLNERMIRVGPSRARKRDTIGF